MHVSYAGLRAGRSRSLKRAGPHSPEDAVQDPPVFTRPGRHKRLEKRVAS